ncbi:phage holin family protein [Turicimonas muris]|uniref:phage holin family protein n=1 Tax=Turicimonas muris TaxID=1796652 RepID=UPI0025A65C20|nr:phage holin family protein [Turicimonas muris]
MAWKNPTQWGDMNNALNILSMLLVFFCALTGGATRFTKGDIAFKFGLYLWEVASSMSAGMIVFLFLKATNTPDEMVGAISGLSAYFGTRLMSMLYGVLVFKIKQYFRHSDAPAKDSDNKKKEDDK